MIPFTQNDMPIKGCESNTWHYPLHQDASLKGTIKCNSHEKGRADKPGRGPWHETRPVSSAVRGGLGISLRLSMRMGSFHHQQACRSSRSSTKSGATAAKKGNPADSPGVKLAGGFLQHRAAVLGFPIC